MKNKGFTLIELLAVIIILGILMIIAIPSVTKYINDSRKSSYIDTAKELIGAARNVVNEGSLEMYDTDATYYIDIACLKTENGGKAVSPYGEFVKEKAYVVVTFDGKGYEYFWTSIDDSGQGIKNLIRYDKLDTDNIESDLKSDDIKIDRGIDGRSKVVLVTERNNCQKEGSTDANGQVNSLTGEENNPITYPEGKNKSTVVVGDIVKIGTEEFYVVKHDGNDLILLSHYNLKVGNIHNSISSGGAKSGEFTSNDSGYGLQSSEARGYFDYYNESIGTISYSNSNYSYGNIGDGLTYSGNDEGPNFPYTYDENSLIYPYVEAYKIYLQGLGATIKKARLLSYEEAIELGCDMTESVRRCDSTPSFFRETSFWLGTTKYGNALSFAIGNSNEFEFIYFRNDSLYGVRPVIVI